MGDSRSTSNTRYDSRSTSNTRHDSRSTLKKGCDSGSTLNKGRDSPVPRRNQYHVVAFIDLPRPEIDQYVCVPDSLIINYDEESNIADVAYPKGNPEIINRLVKDNKSVPKIWKTYQAYVKYSSDCFDKATKEMTRLLKKKTAAPQPITREATSQTSPPEVLPDPERNRSQPTVTTSNTGAKKRPSPVDLDSGASAKLSRTENKMKYAADAAKQSGSNQRCSFTDDRYNESSQVSRTLEGLNEEDNVDTDPSSSGNNGIQDILQASSDHSTVKAGYDSSLTKFINLLKDTMERFKRFAQIAKNITNDVDEFYEFAAVITDCRESLTASGFDEATKIDGLNAEVGDEVLSNEDDVSNDISEAPKQKTAKLTLPPDYDPNDSKWTLRYPNLGPGLVELLPSSGIFVNAARLDECRSRAVECADVAKKLLLEVFSDSALKVCSPTGARPVCQTETGIRPGLDKVARGTIMKYVQIFGRKKRWWFDQKYIGERMSAQLKKCRDK